MNQLATMPDSPPSLVGTWRRWMKYIKVFICSITWLEVETLCNWSSVLCQRINNFHWMSWFWPTMLEPVQLMACVAGYLPSEAFVRGKRVGSVFSVFFRGMPFLFPAVNSQFCVIVCAIKRYIGKETNSRKSSSRCTMFVMLSSSIRHEISQWSNNSRENVV